MRNRDAKRNQINILVRAVTLVAMAFAMIDCSAHITQKFGDETIQPKGPQTTEPRKVSSFSRVQAGESYQVEVTLGSEESVEIEAPKDLLPHIRAEVHGDTLDISSDAGYDLTNGQKVLVKVGVKELTGATASGACEMKVNGQVKTANFKASTSGSATLSLSADVRDMDVETSGASHTTLTLTAKSLNVQGSGSAECNVNGQADKSKIELSGASHFNGGFITTQAEVNASGSSNAELKVLDSLKGQASGASEVRYSGSPKTVDGQTSGSGAFVKG